MAIVTVTIFREYPSANISPYNQTTTSRIGAREIAACLTERNPIERVIKTNNEPKNNEDCISDCILSLAINLVIGFPVNITQVSGLSSSLSPDSSQVPEDRFSRGERSLFISSNPGPMDGKSSGEVIPNLIIIKSYVIGSPSIDNQTLDGSGSSLGAIYKSINDEGTSVPGIPSSVRTP